MDGLEDLRLTVFERLSRLPCEAVLATISPRGAEARVLMLRGFDATRGVLTLYTDAATPKITEITADPRGSLLLYDAKAGAQLRLRVQLEVLAGDAADFAALPRAAQENYGTEPVPGTPIPAPDAYRRVPQASRFAVIEAQIDEIDFVDLSSDPHRRASYRRTADGWSSAWLAP